MDIGAGNRAIARLLHQLLDMIILEGSEHTFERAHCLLRQGRKTEGGKVAKPEAEVIVCHTARPGKGKPV